ncbi:hypothetical protein [Kitasatospora sp. NBC_00315]|uniref:hypothetical protein n=1 Tax=Kitasatospora sp. NBC_00315 TaxID=2975963 RepID=UPI00324A0FCF
MSRTATGLPGLAAAAAFALAAGLLAAPAAAAADGAPVSGPRTLPSPGFAATGVHSGCGDAGEPGWINTAAPTLTVTSTVPDVRFTVRDDATSAHTKVFDATAQTSAGSAQVAVTGLTDGHAYSWRAKGVQADGPTDACRFRVDATAPAQPTVESTDFPSAGTPAKYAGQSGLFTFRATDAASGVACYHYTLGLYPDRGNDCTARGSVLAGPDGLVTVPIRPTSWGTNTLTLTAVDNAGNVTWPTSYTFYAPSNPSPPAVPGDVDGDGVPDIPLPDSAGNLQIISAAASSARPTSTVAAGYAPNRQSWAGYQLAHRGWGQWHAPMDDLIAFAPGTYAPSFYRNSDYGTFAAGSIRLTRPADDPFAEEPTFPADFPADWSKTDQLVALGALGQDQQSSLLTVEAGDLWLLTDPSNYSFSTVRKLGAGSWTGYELIAPGKAADGSLALWSREKASGTLRSYPIAHNADGSWDFAALADPASGTVIGNFPLADYPVLGSSGDGNGDGRPDLYAVTATRHLLTFDGVSTPRDLGPLA